MRPLIGPASQRMNQEKRGVAVMQDKPRPFGPASQRINPMQFRMAQVSSGSMIERHALAGPASEIICMTEPALGRPFKFRTDMLAREASTGRPLKVHHHLLHGDRSTQPIHNSTKIEIPYTHTQPKS